MEGSAVCFLFFKTPEYQNYLFLKVILPDTSIMVSVPSLNQALTTNFISVSLCSPFVVIPFLPLCSRGPWHCAVSTILLRTSAYCKLNFPEMGAISSAIIMQLYVNTVRIEADVLRRSKVPCRCWRRKGFFSRFKNTTDNCACIRSSCCGRGGVKP